MTESTAGAGVHGTASGQSWRKPCRAQGTIAGDGSSMSRGSHAKPDRDDVPELLRRPAPAAPERYRAAPGTGSRGSPARDPAAPARPLPRSSGHGNPVAMATAALPLRALEHLLEGPAPACLRIALSVDGNPAELAEQVYPLLERYEMPASAFIGGDPRSWREAVAETLWQADATAAGPCWNCWRVTAARHSWRCSNAPATTSVAAATSTSSCASWNASTRPRSRPCTRPARFPHRTALATGSGSAAWKTAACFASACADRSRTHRQAFAPRTVSAAPHRQLQQHCAAPCRCSAKLAPHPPRNPACAPPSVGLATARLRRAQWPGGYPLRPAGPAAHRGGCGDRPPVPAGWLAHLSWSPPMSMASSPFPRRRDRQSPSAGRPPEPRKRTRRRPPCRSDAALRDMASPAGPVSARIVP